jgi:hypothetical protein
VKQTRRQADYEEGDCTENASASSSERCRDNIVQSANFVLLNYLPFRTRTPVLFPKSVDLIAYCDG